MPFRDAREVHELLTTTANATEIATAYALRCFVSTATYRVDYVADPRWVEAIVPTEAGREVLSKVSTHPIPRSDFHLALFGLFWFQDPLIDAGRSNLSLVRSIIEDEAFSRRLYWPSSQGRTLYDRYNAMFPDVQDTIASQEVLNFLTDTPLGVYQAGTLVTGPLGIIESGCVRHYPPLQTLGLWHCPMIDCRQLHPVLLSPPPIPLVEGYRLLGAAAIAIWGTPSRWETRLSSWPWTMGEMWRAYSEMPLFLGDCIVGEDRTRLVVAALSSTHGDRIRAIVGSKSRKDCSGNAKTIADRLATDEQLQLLLTLTDRDIKTLLDDLVWRHEIEVPTDEVRQVDATKLEVCGKGGSPSLQLSSLGVREIRQHPVLLLRHLVWNAYLQYGDTGDLDWRLRKPQAMPTQDALMAYLRKAKPPMAIETLVLTSPQVTRAVAEALETRIEVPDERARNLLEWKLGFNLPREDRRLAIVHRVVDGFADVVAKIGVPQSDGDRQAIRSAGVNAFVELEGFVDELLVYLTWILCSDHPKVTRFVYSRTGAASCVPKALGAELSLGSETVRWAASGNTLGTCLRYLQRLNEWVRTLPRADRSSVVRAAAEVHDRPSDAVTLFPFRHVELWGDANPGSLEELASVLNRCVTILNRADIPAVRNGLEHYREPQRFPASDRIHAAIDALRDFINASELERLFPKLYWISDSRTDAFFQTTIDLVDYRGEVFALHHPRTVVGLLSVMDLSSARPLLIAPGNLFCLQNSELLFGIRQDSAYSRYWDDYPSPGRQTLLRATDAV